MNVAGSVAVKLNVADVAVTEPDGPVVIDVLGRVVSGVGPRSSGAKPIPAWSSPPNRVPSLPTQSPRGVANRTIVPWLRDFVGFQLVPSRSPGRWRRCPGGRPHPDPRSPRPFGLSSHR